MNSPPAAGQLATQPRSGVSLSTRFRLSARGWADAEQDLPLRFKFAVLPLVAAGGDGGRRGALALSPASTNCNLSALLPEGAAGANYSLRVGLEVIDALGASAAWAENWVREYTHWGTFCI